MERAAERAGDHVDLGRPHDERRQDDEAVAVEADEDAALAELALHPQRRDRPERQARAEGEAFDGEDRIVDGGKGSDTVRFERGDGRDTVLVLNDTTAGKIDTLRFGAGIATQDIVLTRKNDDLELGLAGGANGPAAPAALWGAIRDAGGHGPRLRVLRSST